MDTKTVIDANNEIQSAIQQAFQQLQGGARSAGLEGPVFETMACEAEYGASMSLDGSDVRVFSAVHHDSEVVYESPMASFDPAAATSALVADMQAALEQFDDVFPA